MSPNPFELWILVLGLEKNNPRTRELQPGTGSNRRHLTIDGGRGAPPNFPIWGAFPKFENQVLNWGRKTKFRGRGGRPQKRRPNSRLRSNEKEARYSALNISIRASVPNSFGEISEKGRARNRDRDRSMTSITGLRPENQERRKSQGETRRGKSRRVAEREREGGTSKKKGRRGFYFFLSFSFYFFSLFQLYFNQWVGSNSGLRVRLWAGAYLGQIRDSGPALT